MANEDAASLLEVKPKELSRFEEVPDLFNPPNTLSGWLCRRGDHRYGALAIEAVNGEEIETGPFLVFGTPKQRYPFGRTEDEERRYHWPAAIRKAVAWEKLDGTNILGYCYPAADQRQWFTTYKTRLTPTLRGSSTHGDFFSLWSEVLTPEIESAIDPNFAISFELWGHRNHHLVSYAEPLAATVLFGISGAGVLVPPDASAFDGLRKPRRLSEALGREGLTRFYEDLRAECQAENKAIDEDHLEGTEGAVLYLEDEHDAWSQWKCKPESVEALHWAGEYLPLSVILPTAWNALESSEVLTVSAVNELLAEEFSEAMIRNSARRVEQAVERVTNRIAWRKNVAEGYRDCGRSFESDGRAAVMRQLSTVFERSAMRDVFNALREIGHVS